MKINNRKISLILLLSLSLFSTSVAIADSNSLTQLDIRKNNSSSSSVDVTLYTTTPYNDSVAVTKKSDNKYVILMPNVSKSSSKSPDLSGLGDIISNVDVKSVNDPSGSYTKVTLTTTKPINIKTHTQKSLPVTEGQKAYRTLLSQNPVHKPVPVAVPVNSLKKEEVKVASVKNANKIVKDEKSSQTKITSENKISTQAAKSKSILKDTAKNKSAQAIQIKADVKRIDKSTPKTENLLASVNNKSSNDIVKNADSIRNNTVDSAAKSENITPENNIVYENNNTGRNQSNMPITLAMIFVPLLGLFFLFKLIKVSMQNSTMLKKAFIANLKNKKDSVSDYESIISADMNWQEKYQKFVAVSNANYEKAPKKLASETLDFGSVPAASLNAQPVVDDTPNFVNEIESPAVNSAPVAKAVSKKANKPKVEISEAVKEMERQISKLEAENVQMQQVPSITEEPIDMSEAEYLESLEKMLHESPNVEKTDLDDDSILKELEQNFRDITVHSEDNAIASKMSNVSKVSKVKKLKAFANSKILEETHRNKPLPKTKEEVARVVNKEGRHVNLGYSKLHSNPRLLEGANLSAADLIAKSNRFLPNPTPLNFKQKTNDTPIVAQKSKSSEPVNNKGYTMATIDEFFALSDDQSKVTASIELSNKVAGSLANIKPSMKIQKATPKKMTNPITQLKSESQESYLNGLIVKSGFNIDKDKGFYLVNLDGEMALIGRIKEEIFVLKKFDRPIEKPLQVRQDNPNVYMVKTDGFRSLVEVSDSKMGVLIEL